MDHEPQPGDLILMRFGGPFGVVVTILQAVLAWRPSPYSHVETVLPGGWTISARKGGASRSLLSDVMAKRPLAIVPIPPEFESRRPAVVAAALYLETVCRHYQVLAYLYIGLSRLHIRPAWLLRALASERSLICSAYADRAWALGGIHLFNDHRPFGAVSPGEIARVGWTYHYDTGPYR